MRDVKQAITDAWLSGDFTGNRRPMARVTLQQAGITQYDVGYNLYTSLIFGRPDQSLAARLQFAAARAANAAGPVSPPRAVPPGVADGRPREMPNVLSVTWQRDADSEIASATIVFANTEPLPLGIAPMPDLDQPGFFTYNRGLSEYSVRWGHTPNEWSGLLVPDNLLRTYEGYGFDATKIPEDDPHLEQTGVWMIDKVEYGQNGTISCTCRDIGRILSDQIIFPPVTPKGFYPLSLTATDVQPGFVAGKTFTKVVTTGGGHDPNHPPPDGWTGPTAGPTVANLVDGDGDGSVRVRVTGVGPPPAGYRVTGYQIRVDNVLLPAVTQLPDVVGAAADVTVPNLTNGDVYAVQAVATYQKIDTGAAEVSDSSNLLFGRPHAGVSAPGSFANTSPDVVADTLLLDTDADGNQNSGETHPGQLVWRYIATGAPVTFTVVLYRNQVVRLVGAQATTVAGPATVTRLLRHTYQVDVGASNAGSTQVVEYQIPDASNLPLSDWNILVYGSTGAVPFVASAALATASANDASVPMARASSAPLITGRGAAAFRPAGGHYYFPPAAGAAPQQTAVINGGDKAVRLTYDTSSNDYYDGANDASIAGHNPRDAFDDNPGSYFVSVGNVSPGRGFAYEWVQGSCQGQTITGVTFHTVKSGYVAYISVFARGAWTQFDPHDVIPYNANLPASHNGANIPFCETIPVPSEGPHTVRMRQPIPGATRVRVTLRNLQNFGFGTYKYRAGVRSLGALTDGSITVSGPAVDNDSPTVVRTYTVNEPPYVQTGVGQIKKLSGQPEVVAAQLRVSAAAKVANDTSSASGAPAMSSYPAISLEQASGLGAQSAAAYNGGDNVTQGSTDLGNGYTTSTPTPVPPGTYGDTGSADGTGVSEGLKYYDYTDIVKLLCAWGGFFWPKNASILKSDGRATSFDFGLGPFGLGSNIDPVLGSDAGRVWGDFENTGTHGVADLTSELWDKKTLLDGIVYVREIIGFRFYIDELGSVVWRHPNIYAVGNDIATLTQQPRRTTEILTLDETRELTALTATLDSRNVRERVFISNTDGRTAAISQGFNPNPIGLRRVGGWTDQNFASQAECQRMADFICLRQLFTYRNDRIAIAGYPKIQVDDQVRIFERVSSETYIHRVQGISSNNDLQTGEWSYDLSTHWLGEKPGDVWVFHPQDFSKETQAYLDSIGLLATDDSPTTTTTTQTIAPVRPDLTAKNVATVLANPKPAIDWGQERLALYHRSDAVAGYHFLTDGFHYRPVGPKQLPGLLATGVVGATVLTVAPNVMTTLQAYTDLEKEQD